MSRAVRPSPARIVALVALALGGLTACASTADAPASATPSVGPNAILPPVVAASTGCARMDAVLADAMLHSVPGQAFVAAQARSAPASNAAAAETRAAEVRDKWIAFVLDFSANSDRALAEAAGDDAQGLRALEALRDYTVQAPPMLRGEIPQFLDEASAMEELAAGGSPSPNPAFEEAANALAADVDVLSACLPTWPLVF